MFINKKIEDIEKVTNRINKSNFVIAYWIHQSTYFTYLHKEVFPNEEIVQAIYKLKHKCIRQMFKSGCNKLKLYKPSEDKFKWLLVLNNESEGLEYNVVVPYLHYEDRVDVNELETTDMNRDSLFVNGKEFLSGSYKKYGINLSKCLSNMEKSRVKLVDKMNSNK